MLIKVLKRLIEKGQAAEVAGKIDVFFAVGRITEAEYNELLELMKEGK